MIRFGHAVRMLDRAMPISDVAAMSGYSDHSHLVRDCRDLAGCSPSELLAERHGDTLDAEVRSHSSKTAGGLPA